MMEALFVLHFVAGPPLICIKVRYPKNILRLFSP